MKDLILFILVSISITNIIQNEVIFTSFRVFIKRYEKLYNFIMCPTCFSFYLGILLSFFIPLFENIILNIFFSGLIASISNKVFAKVLPEGFNLE